MNFIAYNWKIFAFTIIMLYLLPVNAQKPNFGLKQPQEENTLPVSAQPVVQPIVKPKKPATPYLHKKNNNEYILKGGWKLVEDLNSNAAGNLISTLKYNPKDWYNATVPGTVLTSLIDQGVYPDPYFGINNLSIPDSLSRQEWWYRIEFNAPKTEKRKAWIVLNGINYKAQVWLNGKLLGIIKGAFQKKEFEVSENLKEKEANVLAVKILPPPNPGIPHEESPSAGTGPNGGQLCMDGPTFISSEGWDWIPGIRDRNIGIWQDVRLHYSGPVILRNPQIITDLQLPDTTKAAVTIKSELVNVGNQRQTVELKAEIEQKEFTEKIILEPGEKKLITLSPDNFKKLNFKNPRLWWPNGYGEQNLYFLNLKVKNGNGDIYDKEKVRFGMRELSYELTVATDSSQFSRIELNPLKDITPSQPVVNNLRRVEVLPKVEAPTLNENMDISELEILNEDKVSPYLVIKVNGRRIFCKGGNWGMDDGMKRVSRERLEPAMKLHKEANFNMVRNWTGENTEKIFYDLCDEYGMLVWNDFWMSTQGYNLEPTDNLLFLENAKDVINRFRNHPSIAIWCPRNEGYAPPKLEKELQHLVNKLDGTRYYQGNSRNLNLRPSGPWNYLSKPEEYFNKKAFGFSTELGTPSVPTAASMRKMMAKEDLWPISDVWYYHDFHNGQKAYVKAIEDLYGKPDNLEEFTKKAQFINYNSHRSMFEAWNSRMWNDTSGLLLWMTHPAWPSTVWQVYSWDFETFGSYYGSKKACEPVHIQMNLNDNKVIATNTTLDNYEDSFATLKVFDLHSKEIFNHSIKTDIPQNKLTECFTPQLPEKMPEIYLLRLTLTDNNGQLLSENEYWKTAKKTGDFKEFNDLPLVSLTEKIIQKKAGTNQIVFEVKNPSKTPALNVKFNLRNRRNGEILLPAYFSHGYFTLLPGESKRIKVDFPDSKKYDEVYISVDGYNLNEWKI